MVGGEEDRGFTPQAGLILSELVSQYRCINFPKMIEHIKMMPIPFLDILSMLLSGQSVS